MKDSVTDKQIIKALIERNEEVTQRFFFKDCRPLFLGIIRYVFSFNVDYNEFVNEFYVYLMENDALRLRQFEGRSSVYQWMKVVAIRFFITKRSSMIEETSKDSLLEYMVQNKAIDCESRVSAKMDIEYLFSCMSNKRYVYVLRRLIIEDADPLDVAEEMHVTVDNLYNIKKRAIASITQIALNEAGKYERKICKK